MFRRNDFLIGLFIGIIVPVLGFFLFFALFQGLETAGVMSSKGFRPMFRERTSLILGIALVAIALNHYQARYLNNTVRGLVIGIVVWVGVWLWVFGKYIF